MPWPLITRAQLEARVSADLIRRLYDDDNDGAPDKETVEQLLKDASGKVAGRVAPVYPIDQLREMAADAMPDELVRLTLDVAQALVAQRHPEYRRIDGFELMKQAERDLKDLRDGHHNLGVKGPPEPAANQGVRFASGNPDKPEPDPRFADDFGDF